VTSAARQSLRFPVLRCDFLATRFHGAPCRRLKHASNALSGTPIYIA
jgi:hypothetical protein